MMFGHDSDDERAAQAKTPVRLLDESRFGARVNTIWIN
jgi:hypothetical protein